MRKRWSGSPTIAADAVSEIGVSGQSARIARSTFAHAAPSSVSRPASPNACTWTESAPASTAARAAFAIAVGVRGYGRVSTVAVERGLEQSGWYGHAPD